MKKLLDYVEPGDTVVVWRIDRLGRSLMDVLNTVNLFRERGVQLRSVSDGIDPATTSGRLMLNMLATLAEYERELVVERVNAAIAAARKGGTRFGRPLSDPVVIADKLRIVTEARAKGRTAEEAARLVGWSRATLYRHQKPSLPARAPRCSCVHKRRGAVADPSVPCASTWVTGFRPARAAGPAGPSRRPRLTPAGSPAKARGRQATRRCP